MNPVVEALLEGAFDATLDAIGEDVTVDGTDAQAIVSGFALDAQFFGGGSGDAGSKSISVSKVTFPTKPAKNALCTVRGQTAQILSVDERLRHWKLNLGNDDAR